MCGIFGYTGTRTATPILIDGLRTLEYRGYDSAGVYVPLSGLMKAVGPIDNLAAKTGEMKQGTSGIAHTRWATHGPPTEANAHPHTDHAGRIYLVHNGIIENYRELKEMLLAEGSIFSSDTDTEVLAHLVGKEIKTDGVLREALRRALSQVRGTYGVAVMDTENPETIVVARMGSPIVLGLSEHGNFVSSDPSALLSHTKDVVYLEDGEMAIINPKEYTIETILGEERTRAPERIEWEADAVKKGGYDHFMMKEIMEASDVLINSARGRTIREQGLVKLGGIESVKEKLNDIERLTIVGCGSAYYAGMVGKYMIEEFAGIPVDVEIGSELRYRKVAYDHKGALLAITQSGETADTLAAVKDWKQRGNLTLGIVNTVGSTIARETDAGVYNHAGPEIGVASTKAFLSQLEVLALLTVFLGRARGMSRETGQEIIEKLEMLPEHVAAILDQKEHVKAIAEKYKGIRDALFIGRGYHMPIAYEGALKLKEVSYVHAEGYGAGEMKHGPIAMIDEHFPTIALVPQDDVYEKMVSNIEEIRARSGPVIAIATEGDTSIEKIADEVIFIPKTHKILQPILSTIPLQLLAYYMGVAKGYNVDRPRNLAKAVTVE